VLLAALCAPVARAADPEAIENLLDGMPTEEAQCAFLVGLCRSARLSLERAETVPSNADFLGARQGLVGLGRVDEVTVAAEAIARRHGGHDVPCFRAPECVGMIPAAPTAPPKKP
jgi:hypothetical protein